jgi:hypothetical protein
MPWANGNARRTHDARGAARERAGASAETKQWAALGRHVLREVFFESAPGTFFSAGLWQPKAARSGKKGSPSAPQHLLSAGNFFGATAVFAGPERLVLPDLASGGGLARVFVVRSAFVEVQQRAFSADRDDSQTGCHDQRSTGIISVC